MLDARMMCALSRTLCRCSLSRDGDTGRPQTMVNPRYLFVANADWILSHWAFVYRSTDLYQAANQHHYGRVPLQQGESSIATLSIAMSSLKDTEGYSSHLIITIHGHILLVSLSEHRCPEQKHGLFIDWESAYPREKQTKTQQQS